jgi:hypothetical protein
MSYALPASGEFFLLRLVTDLIFSTRPNKFLVSFGTLAVHFENGKLCALPRSAPHGVEFKRSGSLWEPSRPRNCDSFIQMLQTNVSISASLNYCRVRNIACVNGFAV